MTTTNPLFEKAFLYTVGSAPGAGNEGGATFTDDPDDAGGPTKYGITQTTLAGWRGHAVTADDVKNLSETEARDIFYARYWRPLSLDDVITAPAAIPIFDAGVLFGNGVSAINTQRALLGCGYFSLKVDGSLGPKSVEALNGVKPEFFLREFTALLKSRIVDVAGTYPRDKKFQKGWTARVDRYLQLLTKGGSV